MSTAPPPPVVGLVRASFTCKSCGRPVSYVETVDDDAMLLHPLPHCELFDRLDPEEFLHVHAGEEN